MFENIGLIVGLVLVFGLLSFLFLEPFDWDDKNDDQRN